MASTDALRAWHLKISQIASSGMGEVVGRALAMSALDAERYAKELATSRLRMRTGALRRSIRAEARGNEIALQAGESGGRPLRYAGIQLLDKTTTILPKRGKYLAQPVGPALTGAGVARFASPRDVPGLTFIRSRAGKPLLIDDSGSVWYVLHRSVKITGKRVLNDAIEKARAEFPFILSAEIKEALLA